MTMTHILSNPTAQTPYPVRHNNTPPNSHSTFRRAQTRMLAPAHVHKNKGNIAKSGLLRFLRYARGVNDTSSCMIGGTLAVCYLCTCLRRQVARNVSSSSETARRTKRCTSKPTPSQILDCSNHMHLVLPTVYLVILARPEYSSCTPQINISSGKKHNTSQSYTFITIYVQTYTQPS
jgi:hypothetical protein